MLVYVNAAELKAVFRDVKPVFKNALDTAIMGFVLENNSLYITCSSGMVYVQRLIVDCEGPYRITVLYQDLSELLPGRGVVELELSPLFVGIRTDTVSAVLQQANGIAPRYSFRNGVFQDIQPDVVKHWYTLFSETSPVAKSLQREATIIFKPPYAIMKFPTFWLQLPNTLLDTVMTLGELKAVAEFSPTSYSTSADVVEFKRGSALLAIPRNTLPSCKFVEDMLSEHNEEQVFEGGTYLPQIQKFLRSVGAGECKCHFYEEGISLEVSRPNVISSVYLGKCEKPITTLSTFLEYVQMFFKLCDNIPITITSGRSAVCFRTQSLSMLLSII